MNCDSYIRKTTLPLPERNRFEETKGCGGHTEKKQSQKTNGSKNKKKLGFPKKMAILN